jgi:DNA-binding winged helix-turn-helix (wHTH) protein
MDLTTRTLWRGDTRVSLTHKAFDILRVLVERAGHVVARDTLLGAVWPDTNVHPDNVKVLIGEIRRALGDDPARPQFIRSIVKRGYIFTAPVVEAPVDLTDRSHLPVFVGRDAEMSLLLDALDRAVLSERQVVFVAGDGGVGKTALCGAFLRVAATRHAMRATWSECVNLTGTPEPYHPLVDVLGRLARSADDGSVGRVLSRHAPSWTLHRPLRSSEGWRAAAGPQPATTGRMLREIVTAIEALTEKSTLVIWIDDLHWADPATIDVIGSLGQRPDPARLMVVATSRPVETVPAAGALRRVHADLLTHSRATMIRLEPFGLESVSGYLDVQFGNHVSSRAAPALYRTTNGNPLFLMTAVNHLVRSGFFARRDAVWSLDVSADALEAAIPASLASAVARDLEDLAGEERLAIASASVIGVEFSLWLTARAAGLEELVLEAILESLARRQRFILREGVVELANGVFSPLYRFKHSLYQEIVLDRMDQSLRAGAHGRAGLATEGLFEGREREVAGDLACHFHGAGDHPRAARYLKLAAENASRRFAPREAAALLHGAVAHSAYLPAPERHLLELPTMLDLGKAQLAAGEAILAAETLTRLARRAEAGGHLHEQLRALMALSDAQAEHSREDALESARRIAELSARVTDRALGTAAAVRASLLQIALDGWSDAVADHSIGLLRSMPQLLEEESRSLAVRILFLQTMRSAYGAAWSGGRRLLPTVLRAGSLLDTFHCCYSLAVAALHLGRWGDATEIALEGAAIGDRAGSARHAILMRLLQGWIALEAQRWDEARRLSVAERSALEAGHSIVALQMSLLFGGAAAIGLGDFEAAAGDLGRLRDWYDRERLPLDWFWKAQLHAYLSELALRRGELDSAENEARTAQIAADAMPERTWRSRAHVAAAQVAIERHAFPDAERHLRMARRETRGIDAPLASWRIEAVTATLLERTAQPDSARRARIRYERTLSRLERSMDERQMGLPASLPPPDRNPVH